MGKRAAAQKPVKAKVAKVAADEPRVDVAPVLRALTEAVAEGTMNENCAEMLQLAAPFAFAVPTEERHGYEASIVAMIGEGIDGVVNSCTNAAATAEAAINEHSAGVDTKTAEHEVATGEAEAGKVAKDASVAAAGAAATAVQEATQSLASERKREEDQISERTGVQAEKAEYEEAMSGVWSKLKACEFGSRWHERNKSITRVVQLLEKTGIPRSLGAALSSVLKEKVVPLSRGPSKVADRGPFANKALEHAEENWTTHIARLETAISNLGSAIDSCANAVAVAQEAVGTAEAQKNEADDAATQADNAWCTQATRVYELDEELKQAKSHATELNENLSKMQARLSHLEELRAQFAALRDRPKEAPATPVALDTETEAVPAESAADAPTDMMETETTPETAAPLASKTAEVEVDATAAVAEAGA